MSKPDVTSPEWVDWALEQMRAERAEAAEAATRLPDSVPEAPVPAAEVPEPAEVRRRRPVVGLVAAAVALVGVVAGGWWWTGQPDDDHDQARSVAARTRVTPASPVTLPAHGAHTVITVLPSGDLAVKRWVRGSGETRYQQFRLSGALDRSAGVRALARIPPVPRDGSPPGLQTIDAVGATILALACTPGSAAGTAVPVPCGADAGTTGWRVVRPAGWDAVRVTAQLDLDQG